MSGEGRGSLRSGRNTRKAQKHNSWQARSMQSGNKHEEVDLLLTGNVNGSEIILLVDTGSRASLIANSCFMKLEKTPKLFRNNKSSLQGITGTQIEIAGLSDLIVELGSFKTKHCFYVTEDRCFNTYQGLLGRDFLYANNIDIIVSRNCMLFPDGSEIKFITRNRRMGSGDAMSADTHRVVVIEHPFARSGLTQGRRASGPTAQPYAKPFYGKINNGDVKTTSRGVLQNNPGKRETRITGRRKGKKRLNEQKPPERRASQDEQSHRHLADEQRTANTSDRPRDINKPTDDVSEKGLTVRSRLVGQTETAKGRNDSELQDYLNYVKVDKLIRRQNSKKEKQNQSSKKGAQNNKELQNQPKATPKQETTQNANARKSSEPRVEECKGKENKPGTLQYEEERLYEEGNYRKKDNKEKGTSFMLDEPVFLDEGIVIPAYSEAIFNGKLRGKYEPGIIGIIENPPVLAHGLRLANTIVKVSQKGRFPIRLMNFSGQEIRLSRNQMIGVFQEAEQEEKPQEVRELGGANRKQLSDAEFLRLFDFSDLTGEERSAITPLVLQFKDIFAQHKYDLGLFPNMKHEINTGDHPPIIQAAYKVPFHQRETMDKIIGELLEEGIIEPSISPWGAPAILVKKKDSTMRLCIDYRRLNSISQSQFYPLPHLYDSLAQLGKATYFSGLDFISGFWQIEVAEPEKTAFFTTQGQFQFRRLPFGLKSAPFSFARVADYIFAGLKERCCLIYLDDVMVFGRSLQEHMERLEVVFQRIRQSKIKLKPGKCSLLKRKIVYLGHEISGEGIRPDPQKTACVEQYPIPKNVKQIRQYLGFCSFYRRHIKDFSTHAKPLTNLTKKDVPFEWTDECQKAFETLKAALLANTLLRSPDFSLTFKLEVDGSSIGLGAILSQDFPDGNFPIAYASRQLNTAESKMSATEIEINAVLFGLRAYRQFLFARPFVIVSDHAALAWLNRTRSDNPKMCRYQIEIQQYDYTIVHRAGSASANVDALSRMNVGTIGKGQDEIEGMEPDIDLDEIKRLQIENELWKRVRNVLERKEPLANLKLPDDIKTFYLNQKGMLCHQYYDKIRKRNYEQIVVPPQYTDKLIELYHAIPIFGHQKTKKTLAKLRDNFYWPQMDRDVRNFMKFCVSCQLHAPVEKRKEAQLQLFQELEEPFSLVSLDIVGPMTRTHSGHAYILTMLDVLSRFAIAVPLRDQTAESVAKAFVDNLLLIHGTPRSLLTDQGGNFCGHLFAAVCKLLDIKKLRTLAFHPACNGAVERIQQTLVNMISHYAARSPQEWDRYLKYALFAYNSSSHSSTGYSPYFIVFGRDANLPFEVTDAKRHVRYDLSTNYVSSMVARLQDAYDMARSNSKEKALYRQKLHDTKHKPYTFKVADLVFKRVMNLKSGDSRKLNENWEGPYRVLRRMNEVDLVIRHTTNGKILRVHQNLLKFAYVRDPPDEQEAESEKRSRDATSRPPGNVQENRRENVNGEINVFDYVPAFSFRRPIENETQEVELETNEHTPPVEPLMNEPPVITHSYQTRSRGTVPEQNWVMDTNKRQVFRREAEESDQEDVEMVDDGPNEIAENLEFNYDENGQVQIENLIEVAPQIEEITEVITPAIAPPQTIEQPPIAPVNKVNVASTGSISRMELMSQMFIFLNKE